MIVISQNFFKKLTEHTTRPYFIKHSIYSEYHLHMHDFYEIEICCRGSGINHVNGEELSFTRGTCFIYLPHTIHSLNVNNHDADRQFDILDIAFRAEFLHSDAMNLVWNLGRPIRIEYPENDITSHINHFDELLARQDKDEPFFEEIMRTQLENIIYRIMEIHSRSNSPRGQVSDENDIQLLLRYIAQNIDRNPKIRELAGVVHVSPTYFSEYFRAHIGISYREYITNLRMNRARNLLANSPYSLAEISQRCGFSSESALCHAVRQYFGRPASSFRN